MLHTPKHITAAHIADNTLLYPWDEWNVRDSYQHDGAIDVFDGLEEVSDRGRMALAVASGEWLYHRYALVNTDTTALQYLEAAWAGNIALPYCHYVELDDDEWRGLVRGPLSMMIAIINDGYFCWEENGGDYASHPMWIVNMVRLVLPEPALPAFETWLETVLERLAAHCPIPTFAEVDEDDLFPDEPEREETLGDPVPRELFDTASQYEPAQRDTLLNRFLQGLTPDTHQFLHDQEWLKDAKERSDYRYP